MSKTIAVWGSPRSGKTTFSVKLANEIYERYKTNVVVLFTDISTPTIPVLFPSAKRDTLFSVGKVLSKTDITVDETIKNLVLIKNKSNFGILGYLGGENKFTYPRFDESKARELLDVLKTLANIVIIDCMSNLDDSVLSTVAVGESDEVIRLASPDLSCLGWYLSQLPLVAGNERHIQGINIPDADICVPVSDVRSHLGDVSFTLPFSREVKQQLYEGKLFESVSDKKFNTVIGAIADKVVE